jgi:hypothetical protein
LKSLLKRSHSGLSFLIVGRSHQQADAPHALALLRARRERPSRGRRAAKQRDELASFHCSMPPVLPTQRIAHPT